MTAACLLSSGLQCVAACHSTAAHPNSIRSIIFISKDYSSSPDPKLLKQAAEKCFFFSPLVYKHDPLHIAWPCLFNPQCVMGSTAGTALEFCLTSYNIQMPDFQKQLRIPMVKINRKPNAGSLIDSAMGSCKMLTGFKNWKCLLSVGGKKINELRFRIGVLHFSE